MPPTEPHPPLWPFVVYFAAVLALVASMLGLSSLLGQRHQDRDADAPYEAGVAPTGSARLRFTFLTHASRQNGEATRALVREMQAETRQLLDKMDARMERMDERADERHREVIEVIRTLRA